MVRENGWENKPRNGRKKRRKTKKGTLAWWSWQMPSRSPGQMFTWYSRLFTKLIANRDNYLQQQKTKNAGKLGGYIHTLSVLTHCQPMFQPNEFCNGLWGLKKMVHYHRYWVGTVHTVQHLKIIFVNFGNFQASESGSRSVFPIRIWIQDSQIKANPDPQHCKKLKWRNPRIVLSHQGIEQSSCSL